MTDALDDLLQKMPPENASEAEIEAFMDEVMATPGGADLIRDFASKITDGGSLDAMLKEEKAEAEKLTLASPARFIFRAELTGTAPLITRRLSLPADCTYFHLHCALQDAFGWSNAHPHRFEVWEGGQRELVFSLSPSEDHYGELENRVLDLFSESVSEFRYLILIPGEEGWTHRIVIENFVPSGTAGTSPSLTAHLHDGSGHAPPEACGGPTGFQAFLKGAHPLAQNYDPTILAQFQTSQPDLSKVTFRDPATFPRI